MREKRKITKTLAERVRGRGESFGGHWAQEEKTRRTKWSIIKSKSKEDFVKLP